MREPGGDVAQIFALVSGTALAIATLVLWLLFVPFKPIRIDYVTLLVASGLVVVLHEIVHAVVFSSGSKRERRVDIVWRKYLPHARYHGALSRTHYLVVLLAPFVVISIGTVVASVALGLESGDLVLISLVNALFSGADLVAALLVWEQMPARALVRRQGDAVLWRVLTQPPQASAAIH